MKHLSRLAALVPLLGLSVFGCSSEDDSGGGSAAVGGAPSTGAGPGVGGTGGVASGGVPGTGAAASGGAASGGTGGEVVGSGGDASGGAASGGSGGDGSGGDGSGGTSTGGGPSAPVSDLPAPPTNNVPRPSGSPGNLKVLNWAGFKAAVSYTFDDSLSSQTQNYGALNNTGVRMTFFIVCNNNFQSTVWTQAAADGHELGNHTSHHCQDNGSQCAWGSYSGSLATELSQCNQQIMTTHRVPGVYTTAAPYGAGGYAQAAQALFFLNRGVAGGQISPNDNTNPFSLPAYTIQEAQTFGVFNQQVDSARNAGRWQIMLVHSLGGDGGYAAIAASDLLTNINYAKGLGDVWIDSMVNVGAYWRGQKVLSQVTPTTSGSDRTWTWTLPANFPPGKFLRVTVDGGTLKQGDAVLAWDSHGYYEVALDAGSLTLSP